MLVFDGEGMEGEARIQQVDQRGRVTLEVLRVERGRRDSPLRLHLVQGLPRAQKLEWVLQKATELGVSQIGVLLCQRSLGSAKGLRGTRRWSRWRRILEEAARQCGRARVPDLVGPWDLDEFLEFQGGSQALRLVLWEEARGKGLSEALRDLAGPPREVWLVVGPEGGLEPWEVDRMVEAGFIPVGLGPRTLRTETAGAVALAILQFLFGDLGG